MICFPGMNINDFIKVSVQKSKRVKTKEKSCLYLKHPQILANFDGSVCQDLDEHADLSQIPHQT